MLSFEAVIILTGVLTAIACSLVGTYLVLRRTSMVGDAISHSVLLGIVFVFWITAGERNEWLMVFGAGSVGLLTVLLIETIHHTGRVREDASIGLVFPALFSIGVILVSRFPSTVHLDIQHVLYGEIAFAPLRKLELFGQEVGYRSLWVLGTMSLVNLIFVLLFYKELKLSTFDRGLAAALGFMPTLIHYLLMALVSATTVVAFDAVGSILVVAMLIVPPAAAYLLTDRLSMVLAYAVLFGAVSSVGGYYLARWINGSVAGSMATVAGLIFAVVFLVSPTHGAIARILRLARVRQGFNVRLLVSHLEGQHGSADLPALRARFRWSPGTERAVVGAALRRGLVKRTGDNRLTLTESGRALANEAPGAEAAAQAM